MRIVDLLFEVKLTVGIYACNGMNSLQVAILIKLIKFMNDN